MGSYKPKVETRVAKSGVKPISARVSCKLLLLSRYPTLLVSNVAYAVPFPVEIFGVIAGLLIGCHPCGSVANLKVASRAIHHETLPVLYESVLLDNVKKLPYYGGGE
jgi:hypothetical protein